MDARGEADEGRGRRLQVVRVAGVGQVQRIERRARRAEGRRGRRLPYGPRYHGPHFSKFIGKFTLEYKKVVHL